MTGSFAGRSVLMSGGSRGIGLAIALRLAREGANVTILAKTDTPHPRLEGTVHTAVEEIRAAGGGALGVVGDVRDDDAIARAVEGAVAEFGGIDVVVNNASVIDLAPSEVLPTKRYDLMQDVNVRGTFMLTRAAVPHLRRSDHAHVLSLSPPLNLEPRWLGAFPGYMLAKYGMTLATLGFAHELASDRIAANTLWPRTTIRTAAVANVLGGDELMRRSRSPEIYADAAFEVLRSDPAALTGRSLIVEDVLAEAGVTDLARDSPGVPEEDLYPDVFL